VGAGITGAVRYVLGEGRDPATGRTRNLSGGEKSRVTWFGGTGFGFQIVSSADADLARRVMEFDAQNQASRTRLCIKDCVHLSLGWRPGQTPTVEEMEAAALEALAAIGMGNARALFAIHCDEAYAHIHIVASKINPATGRAYDLKGNYLKLSQWAENYERAHGGVICTARQEANEMRDAIRARDTLGVLAQITKQRATFSQRDLDRILAKEIKATGTRTEFARKILAIPDVVPLSDEPHRETCRFSTRSILDAEGYVLRAAQGLTRQRDHNIGRRIIASVLSRPAFQGMTGEQRQAMHHALKPDGLAIIDGRAGTGKSFTLAAIREAYEARGCQVIGLAPTNAVAQDMARDGFRRAGTIHSELFALNNGRTVWTPRTVVVLDEAAMVDTKLMAMVTAHAFHAGAKLILVGDDRRLSSIDHGGMFGALKERYGAAQLTSVRRQVKDDDRRATELMAEGNFHEALERYEAKGAIHWTASQDAARAALVRRWAEDTAQDPERSRFVFAYTNLDVDDLNRDLRQVRQARGELGEVHEFETKHGRHAFAVGDRLQFTGTNKPLGIFNGNAGVIERIEGEEITVRLDGSDNRRLSFNATAFAEYRHGYAGTIYKGQGRTIDQTYLYHSAHWRSAASYVALSRHRQKTELFVAQDVARDLNQLARQMGRVEERRAASQFFLAGEQLGPVRPMTPSELLAQLAEYAPEWRMRLPVKDAFSGGRAQARRQNYAALRNADGVAPGPSEAEPELTPGGSREIGKATRTGAVTPKSMLTAWRQLASWLTRRIVVSLRPVLKRRRPVTSHDR
jgi:Ti-type conjugative transfer relaxase TraA